MIYHLTLLAFFKFESTQLQEFSQTDDTLFNVIDIHNYQASVLRIFN